MSEEKDIPEEESTDNSLQSTGKHQPLEENIQPDADPQSQLSNSPSEIKNMEVHHHGHVHEKKKWKEYVFQFFMLFLAVFCGFLAENYREHYVEQQRAHMLAKALNSNLAYDTSKLGFTARLRAEAITNNKLLIEELSKPEQNQNNILLQNLSASLGNHLYFLPYSGTFEQLKNSGALRYFPDSISQSLTAYEQAVKQNALTQNLEQSYITASLQPFILANIDFKNASSFIDTTDSFDPVLLGNISSKNVLLLPSNTENPVKNIDRDANPLFKTQLYSFATNSLRFNRFELWEYKSLQHQAIAIMKLLKKEYHLK